MVNRNGYDPILDSLSEISKHYTECSFEDSISQLYSFKDSFDIKLMFVGHFSAGKSALINGLLERPGFLKESQLPQTAVAAELHYDQNECIYAYRSNGIKETLTEQSTFDPDKYSHLEYHLAAQGLKQISDYTIVDTPGFDSGVEAHTKALSGYIGKGSAYIIVIDEQKGSIDDTTMRFIKEISQYSRQIAVLINKCDLIPPSSAEQIAASAKAMLLVQGCSYPVYTISARDKDVKQQLISIISAFDAQESFDKAMKRQISAELNNMNSILQLTQQNLYMDNFDLDEEIRSYTQAWNHAEEIVKQKRREATQSIDTITEQVITQIRSALIGQEDSIIYAILSGNQAAAEAIIVETIRPILLSSMKNISIQQIDDVTKALDFTGLTDIEKQEPLLEAASTLATNIREMIFQDTYGNENLERQNNDENKKGVYRAATGLAAILTDIIEPWMEVIIILLPDIIPFLKGLFGESDSDLLKRRFKNNMLPQICQKLRPQVRQSVEANIQKVLDEFQTLMDEKLKQIKASIAMAEAKKKERKESFETYRKHLDEDISLIQQFIQQMR